MIFGPTPLDSNHLRLVSVLDTPIHDDDFPGDDQPMGKLIYTDFDVAPDRAPYAVPPGTPALQGCGPEFEPEVEVASGASRRAFLYAGILGIAGLSATTAWGLATGVDGQGDQAGPGTAAPLISPAAKSPAEMIRENLEDVRLMADQPIETLVKVHLYYILIVSNHGGCDRLLWSGMERLARWSLDNRQAEGVRIARRLLDSFVVNPPPSGLHGLVVNLDEMVWDWQRRHR